MPLQDIDPNLGRRNSKASTTSGRTVKDGPKSSAAGLPAASGVLSMLRTGTETGDIGTFSMNTSRYPKLPSSISRNGSHVPRSVGGPSRTSSQYSRHNSLHGSIKSNKSQHSARSGRSARERTMPGEWPFSQYPFAGSHERPFTQSEARSSLAQESVRSMPLTGHEPAEAADRSRSLTNSIHPHPPLHMHRSMASLRSQPDPGPRSRTPQSPGLRLAQHSYRPGSPALSDTAGSLYNRRPPMRPPVGPRSFTMTPLYQDQGNYAHPRQYQPPSSRTIEELRKPFINQSVHHSAHEYYPPRPFRQYPPSDAPIEDNQYHPVVPENRYPPPRPAASPRDWQPVPPRQTAPTSAPYSGFVQRVKNALEERASTERSNASSPVSMDRQGPTTPAVGKEILSGNAVEDGVHTYGYEPGQDDGVPGIGSEHVARHSVDDIQEDSHTVKRLTRDLIKAGMDAMSDVVPTSDAAEDGRPESLDCEFDSGEDPSIQISYLSNDAESVDANGQQTITVEHDHNRQDQSTASTNDRVFADDVPSIVANEETPTLGATKPWLEKAILNSEKTSDASDARNRRTFPVLGDSTQGSSRPLSMPAELTRDVIQPPGQARNGDESIRPLNQEIRPSNKSPMPQQDQQAISLSKIASKDPRLAIPAEYRRQSDSLTTTPSMETLTRVTILPSCPTSSLNLLDDRTRHDPRFMSSGLGTVPEVDIEPSTTTGIPNETVEFALPRLPPRSNQTPESPRRSSGGNEGASSAAKNFLFPLPDLTEDSQEDASTTNLRMLGNKHPMLRGRGGFKDFRRTPRPPPKQSPMPEPLRSYFSRSLKDSHNLPSFNFSHTDLTSKLNAALGFRNSRSLEDLTQTRLGRRSPLPLVERPTSAKSMVQDRYRSFFLLNNESQEDVESQPAVPSVIKSIAPDDEILSEIEQMSIPSVKNLSLRLSELFPSIRSSRAAIDLDKVDEALSRTVREIRGVSSKKRKSVNVTTDEECTGSMSAPISRRGTILSEGTGAKRVRISQLQLNKELPPLPPAPDGGEDSSDSKSEGYQSARASQDDENDEVGSDNKQRRYKSTDDRRIRLSESESYRAEKRKLKRKGSLPTLRGSSDTPLRNREVGDDPALSDDTRTADFTQTTNAVNITDTIDNNPRNRAKRSKSDPEDRPVLRPDNTLRVIRSMSPGFDANLVPNSTPLEPSKSEASGKKHSLTSKRANKRSSSERAGAAIDPRFFHPEENRHSAVNPGDRYPTSALGAPPGLSMDESRSYFSDDSDDEGLGNGKGKRRRFTRLKVKRSMPGMASPNPSPVDRNSEYRRTPNQESMVFVDAPHAPAEEAAHDPPAVGMSKAEFHAKRFVEKLRVFFFRSGEALKSFGKKRREVEGSGGNDGYQKV